jgi:glycosyltransferase involved in cell wall biosynthesis
MGYSPRALDHVVDLPDEFLEKYLPSDRFTIAYAGTIGISNALETFFAAIEAMQTREDIHFLILGDGSLLPQYRHEFDRLPNLTFVPRVVKDAVPSLLARCDLLYLSTRNARLWDYGQSLNKLIDYMLSARPVVASFSGFQSMVNEADSGSFIPAGDVGALLAEIQRYVEMGAEERDRTGQRGREWILRHRGYPSLAQEYARVLFESSDDCPG